MPRYIENYNECTDPTTGDYLWIVDASAAAGDKDRKVDVGLFPRLAVANTFTRGVSISTSLSNEVGLNVLMPTGITSSTRALRWAYDSALRGYVQTDVPTNAIVLSTFDNGSGIGCYFSIGRNSNASTPAAGLLYLVTLSGTTRRVWADATGLLRIHTADPTNANDQAGTIVGSQSSHIDYKDVLGDPVGDQDALQYIVDAAARVKRFNYKSGSYGNQEFSGIVLSGATLDRYGMDADADHPAGKSLSIATAIGDLFLAIRGMNQRLMDVEMQVATHSSALSG